MNEAFKPPSRCLRLVLLAAPRVISFVMLVVGVGAAGPAIRWQHLSSAKGDLPVPPGGSTQQTGAVLADFDGDGINDFILSFRQKPPALV
jgi:hypothetical protein